MDGEYELLGFPCFPSFLKSLRELSPDTTDISRLSLRGLVSELPQVLHHCIVEPPVSEPEESELGWVWDLVAETEPCVVEDEAGLHARMLQACVNAAGARFDAGGELVFPRPPPLIKFAVMAGVGMRCSLPGASGVARPEPSVLLDVVVLPEEARRCRGAHGDE